MIFGHLSPPVADAGSHGHRWREITTKISDITNNKVNSIIPAPYVLNFSLTIHLVDICGSIVGAFDDAAGRNSLYSPQIQSTHIAGKRMKRAVRGSYHLALAVG